ncbi:SAM-dependent methyltransferase [Paludibacterium paludis]|nr:SAM-dependent methyltransferase [Paludibacterium paludis]
MRQNSALPEFWETRYLSGVTPWDSSQCPPEVLDYIGRQAPGLPTLVPGCGSAVEVAHMVTRGLKVLAVDFSDAAVKAACEQLGTLSEGRVVMRDFFALEEDVPYEWVYERAFLCALPPALWPDYAAKMARLVSPQGCLAGYFFLAETPKGPPFGTSLGELQALLGEWFTLETSRSVHSVSPIFQGREFWQVWRRRKE